MDGSYEGIVDWFLKVLDDEDLSEEMQGWLNNALDEIRGSRCSCDVCKIEPRVLRALDDGDKEFLLKEIPTLRMSLLVLVNKFLGDNSSIISEDDAEHVTELHDAVQHQIELVLESVGVPPARRSRSTSDVMAIIVTQMKADRNKTKALPAAAGEETEGDSDGESEVVDCTEDTTPEDGDNMNKKNIATVNSNNDLLNNPISSEMVGYSFTKNGVNVQPPPGVTYSAAIDALRKQAEEEEQVVSVDETIRSFVLEGAFAFQNAMAEKYGWVNRVATPNFWGPDSPPQTVEVPIGVGKSASVIWGRVVIPGIDGYLSTGLTMQDNRFYFSITGEVKRKHMPQVKELIALTEKHTKENSIYRGHALELTLPDPRSTEFSPLNAPVFMDLSAIHPEELIFSDGVGHAITTNLFVPVTHSKLCRELGIDLKRGALLAGVPGTGKTFVASVLAKLGTANGWTYFYVKEVKDVARMYRLAAEYSPAILFVEDIDIIAKGEVRTQAMNDILLALDGIDTKGAEVLTVFTTNEDPKVLNSAFKRARRIDFVIEVKAPDTEAVKKLIRLYSRGRLAESVTLEKVAEMLAGQIPATIATVCSAALLSAAGRMAVDAKATDVSAINDSDLEGAAFAQLEQLRLTKDELNAYEPNEGEEMAADILGKHIAVAINAVGEKVVSAISHENQVTAPKNGKSTNGKSASAS